MIREVIVAHLGHFPTRQIAMQPIDKRHVIADDIRHRREKMPRLHHNIDRLLGIAEHRDAGVASHRLLAALELAGLAIGLHHGDDLLRHLLQVSNLVEADSIPDLNHALVTPLLLTE